MKRTYKYMNDELTEVFRQTPGPRIWIRGDMEPYLSPIDNRLISSRKDHREDLLRNNCRPWEGQRQEVQEASRQRDYDDNAFDKSVGEGIEKTYHDLKNHNIEPEKDSVIPFTFGMD